MKASTPVLPSQPFGGLESQSKFCVSLERSSSAGSTRTTFKHAHGSHKKATRSHGSVSRAQRPERKGQLYRIADPFSGHISHHENSHAVANAAPKAGLRVKRHAGIPAGKLPRKSDRPEQAFEVPAQPTDHDLQGSRGSGFGARQAGSLVSDIDVAQRGTEVASIPQYAQANAEYMREQEIKLQALPTYMETVQTSVTGHMRAVLIDWLVEVADEFKLVTETLYLTVAYLDRFLSVRHIRTDDLQLLGVVSMCIAAKFEEIFPPSVEKFAEITDNCCRVRDIAAAEMQMLSVLGFHLSVPTAKVFLQRFLRAAQTATTSEYRYLEHLARYVLELSLLDHTLLVYRTSTIAAAALFLARLLLARAHCKSPHMRPHVIWTRTMEHYAFHTAADLRNCVRHLHQLLLAAGSPGTRTTAVRTKYKSQRRGNIASMRVLPSFTDEVFEPCHAIMVPAHLLSHIK